MTRRLAAVLAAACAALSAGLAGAARANVFYGVVPDVPTGSHLRSAPIARAANLPYSGGPVLHSNRTHLIFWQPSGSGMSYEPGYESIIERFLARVAADSRKPTNVYGLTGQYSDSRGPAAYDSKYGGAVLATDPLPANGCTEPLGGPGWSHCLDDTQLEAEIAHVIGVDQLPTTPRDVYFLVTPNGLGSCEASGPSDCALGGDASGSYCGYHSASPDSKILYAVIPYNAVGGHCESGNPRPNGNAADPTISTISHEHSEMVTDPFGTAWIDGSSNEDGDLCIADFGPNRGGSGNGAWNEVIDGGHYYLQEEWSNDDGSCQPRDEADSISLTAPRSAAAGRQLSFVASGFDPDGVIVAYEWFFGDGHRSHRRRVVHAYQRGGQYRVILRATDGAGNYAYVTQVIRISKSPAHGLRRRRRRP